MESITSLGIGGILIYLFLKELFNFLSKKKNGHSSGEKNTDYWHVIIKGIVDNTVDVKVLPLLIKQIEILNELKSISNRQIEMLIKSEMRQDEIKEGIGKASNNIHGLRGDVQGLLGRIHGT